jgi:hypothetical protein
MQGAIHTCHPAHSRDDYERQAGFREGHYSYEFTYDWLPHLASPVVLGHFPAFDAPTKPH